MTKDDIIRMAREAGQADGTTPLERSIVIYATKSSLFLEKFAALVAAAQREKVAKWMIERRYATGHGDTIEDLLKELEWQVAEREREACARECLGFYSVEGIAQKCHAAIRARSDI